jgi:hypothetical protein
MKKRGVLFGKFIFLMTIFLFSMIVFSHAVLAAENDTGKVDLAYSCLQNKVADKCDKLNTEEKIFSLLALHQCKNDLILDSYGEQCWPSSNCKIKTTAQAILALHDVGQNTDDAEKWLITHNATPSDVEWYLEIESSEATTCTINYESSSATYTINIGEDKKIDKGAGNCLPLATGGWWLRVDPSCYNEDIEVSCDKGFLTTLLFKKKTNSNVYHVSGIIHSESADGTTSEKIDSFCFSAGSTCDYEGSLWAAFVLNSLDYDVSVYLPYLITMRDDYEEFIPESFLFLLTGSSEFQNKLFTTQKNDHWKLSNDEYYDTAMALYPFQYDSPPEKENAQKWLLGKQGADGCWNGIRDTAFILYSVWYRNLGVEEAENDCGDADYYCMSKVDCEGRVLYDYDCAGAFVCCDTPKTLETCSELSGERCNSNEQCVGGTSHDASDLDSGETCCVGGVCEVPAQESDCESSGGICRTYECNDGEQESLDICNFGDVCCVKQTQTEEKKSYWYIWVLLLLIFLIVLGIIFKDKLIPLWVKLKTTVLSKFSKKKGGGPSPRGPGGPRFPPRGGFPNRPMQPPQRRILPPSQRSVPASRPVQRTSKPGEIDDVLKKLREMGK